MIRKSYSQSRQRIRESERMPEDAARFGAFTLVYQLRGIPISDAVALYALDLELDQLWAQLRGCYEEAI